MATVFLVSESPNHNTTGALRYGDKVVAILPPNQQIAFSTAPTIRRIERALENFCDEDYLLLTGDPACIGIACAIASKNNNGRYRCLKWDRRERVYIPIEIDIRKEKDNG